jgi:hypothetical protein
VSLWYVLAASAGQVGGYDTGEFAAVRWVALGDVAAEAPDTHRPRFAAKLAAAGARRAGPPG